MKNEKKEEKRIYEIFSRQTKDKHTSKSNGNTSNIKPSETKPTPYNKED